MKRQELSKGIFYTSFEQPFKKNRLSIHIRTPLKRETLTETALLPFLLERGCASYPDMTAVKRRLNMLYGASLSTSSFSLDYARILSLSIEGVAPRYLRGDDPSAGQVDLLLDLLFRPVLRDGAFLDEWLAIEREKLRTAIHSEMNDKRGYCLKKAGELFFEGDVRALPQNGVAEDLDGIDGRRLYEVLGEMLCGCTVEIIQFGGGDALSERMADAFADVGTAPEAVHPPRAMPYAGRRDAVFHFEVEQDKYAMLYTAGGLLSEREQSVFRLANVILGASPTSRLFMNVREKESLCYYCASRPGFMSGTLTVDSGVEYENIGRLTDAVQRELRDMAAGNIGDREFEEGKLMLKNNLAGVGDTAEGLGSWYLNAIYRLGRPVSPAEETASIASVTKEEIAALMSRFRVNVTALITGEEAKRQ